MTTEPMKLLGLGVNIKVLSIFIWIQNLLYFAFRTIRNKQQG